ncbi:S9 family peptidase [Agromyces sp. S2-1-8]|uniref:alpha/beta hydrolase family protein n=1 Tax=unclassified Agromyces TaxID=2639701 RepID=UPI001E2E2A88|nr:dienelactone hydrolase family protein [Agromyces sp. S2-1-8]MCD5346721.1 dienelactone hydrolase family protein [Agromyces sp. S2-1-8]
MPSRRTLAIALTVGCLVAALSACAGGPGGGGGATSGADASATAEPAAEQPTPPSEQCGDTGVESSAMLLPVGEALFDVGVAGSGTTTAIFAHQRNQDECGFWPYASSLAEQGVQVLLVNNCGYGATECPSGANHVVDDGADALLAAADWAREHGAERVVVIGASMGGTAAVVAGGRDGDAAVLDGVADLSGPISFRGYDSMDDAPALAAPLFLAVAPDDSTVSVDELQQLADASASDDVTIVGDGVGHGWAMLTTGTAFNEFADRLTAFVTG